MRRRRLLALYLVLLALSTAARWRAGAFTPPPAAPYAWTAGSGSAVLVLLDARTPAAPGTVAALGLRGHRVTLFPPGADPGPALQAAPSHLVALGSAGPAAVALAAAAPGRVRSLTLIDADGIEEFDLLGEHHLNRVLRRAEVASLATARALLPHFGLLDPAFDGAEARARTLLGQDRRAIRDELAHWAGPTVVFVTGDAPARLATAREHHRLLPQSGLAAWRGDALAAFLDTADAGTAVTRATASPERVAAAEAPFDPGGLASAQGTALWVVLGLLALVTLLSEDLACVTAGVLVARGSLPLVPSIVVCYAGIVLGDQLLYLLGRSAGRALVTRIPFRWLVSADDLDRASAWFRQRGMRVVLTSRFLPGTRFPVYVTAGILRAGFVRFALWLVAIGALWTPAVVLASYAAARRGRNLVEALPGATWPWALAAVVLAVFFIHLALRLATAEGRRALVEGWKRLRHRT
ncbi:MAG TPA: DedA family protein [Gemmatimonadales bacterium]|nr:DedA family protein [Gemmatimonadales bacterium]